MIIQPTPYQPKLASSERMTTHVSHAQREVFEDTLLEACLRAEQFDKAETMLSERLNRRTTVRDTFWLGRMQAGLGQREQARASFETAAQGWASGDVTSSELTTLGRLTSEITAKPY